MPQKSSKADLHIYLASQEVTNPADIVKRASSLKSFDLEIRGINPCTLFVKKTYSNYPRWANFFAPHIPVNEFGQNSSTGALLYAKISKAIFVLTFGQGHHLVDTAKIVMNFGLKTALNLLDVASIRSVDKASFEQHPTQTREQTGIATEIQYFGLNIERDLLRAITGKPKDEKFGNRISGMDALKLSVEIELKDLAGLLKNLWNAHNDDSYKKGVFAWVDHIGQVKDKSLNERLDELILDRINSAHFDRTWLCVPEVIDWNRVVGFKYSSAPSFPRYYDIRIPDLLETVKNNTLDIQTLKRRKISCVDSDDCPVFEKPAYFFIYAEVDYESDVYVLNNGKWYKVSHNFAQQVTKFFKGIEKYKKSLPIYDDETETDYNQRVANNDGDSFVLLDSKNIYLPNAASPVEPCDLFRNGKEFIHVKRYSGSAVLSHLFNQGLVSGELFQMEPEFRKCLNSRLPAKFKLTNPNDRPKRDGYQVVFAVISESDEEDLSIPFFSKISLRHVVNRLQAIGFVVTVAKILVDEMKKKTKKFPSHSKKI